MRILTGPAPGSQRSEPVPSPYGPPSAILVPQREASVKVSPASRRAPRRTQGLHKSFTRPQLACQQTPCSPLADEADELPEPLVIGSARFLLARDCCLRNLSSPPSLRRRRPRPPPASKRPGTSFHPLDLLL